MEKQNIADVESVLLGEIALIANRSCASLDPMQSLARNGINSLGFMELLLSIRGKFGCDFIDGGLNAGDTASVRALARRICEME